MDVLELPRPVINFLRTMSKEMNRYSLCWDIYGGSESVTLTLTWKCNDLYIDNNSNSNTTATATTTPVQPQQQVVTEQTNIIKQRDRSVDSNSQKLLNNKDSRKSRKQSIENETTIKNDLKSTTTTTSSSNVRGKSLENLNNINKRLSKVNFKNDDDAASPATVTHGGININRSNTINNDIYMPSSQQQQQSAGFTSVDHASLCKPHCPPPSLAYMKRKQLQATHHQKPILNKQPTPPPREVVYQIIQSANNNASDPWIKRNNNNYVNEVSSSSNDNASNGDVLEINNETTTTTSSSKSITAIVTKLDPIENGGGGGGGCERKLSLQSTDVYTLPLQQQQQQQQQQVKVTFDPNLHYI